jgi:hypothetical protein
MQGCRVVGGHPVVLGTPRSIEHPPDRREPVALSTDTDRLGGDPLNRWLKPPLLRRSRKAAYDHRDHVEYRRGDAQDLAQPILAREAEVVAQAFQEDPRKLD